MEGFTAAHEQAAMYGASFFGEFPRIVVMAFEWPFYTFAPNAAITKTVRHQLSQMNVPPPPSDQFDETREGRELQRDWDRLNYYMDSRFGLYPEFLVEQHTEQEIREELHTELEMEEPFSEPFVKYLFARNELFQANVLKELMAKAKAAGSRAKSASVGWRGGRLGATIAGRFGGSSRSQVPESDDAKL